MEKFNIKQQTFRKLVISHKKKRQSMLKYWGMGGYMRTVIISLVFFMIVIVGNAHSQVEKICIHEGTNIENCQFEKDEETQVGIHAWITKENTPAYTCPSNGEIINRLSLRAKYRIIEGHYRDQNEGKKWSLLIAGTENKVDPEKIIGWVSHEDLLFNKRPLINPETNIFEKVLIKQGDVMGGRGLQIYYDKELRQTHPQEKDVISDKESSKIKKTKDAIEVRTVFYVYDFYPKITGKPSSPETKSLLISPKPLLDIYTEREPLLIGWIDRSKVTFWNSRTACEFPVGEQIILETDRGIVNYEPAKTPLPHNALRNPILSDDGEYYRIGSFARLEAKQLIERKKLEEITTGFEVLFVIDGTRSMTRAFKATLEGVERIARQLVFEAKNAQIEQPRFAVLFYRDKSTQEPVMIDQTGAVVKADPPYCKMETRLFKMGNIGRFMENLKAQIPCDSDRTQVESVYLGLAEGVQNCGWEIGEGDEPTRVRFVIHMGDEGDNGRGGYNPQKLAKIMKTNSIFKYFVINVQRSTINRRFADAVRPIVDLMREQAEFLDNSSDVAEAVMEKLLFSNKKTIDVKTQINIISKGFAGTTEGTAGVVSKEILEYAKKIIKANNINLENYDAFQHYIEGKIKKDTNLKKYILVEQTDVEKITNFLTRLIETSGVPDRRKAWNGLLKMIIGDESCKKPDGSDMSIGECNKMRNGIPIKAGFMRYTREQFLNLGYQDMRKVICEAKVILEQFRFLTQDKRVREVVFNNRQNCDFECIPDFDINGDGIIIRDGKVFNNDINTTYVRKATENDLEDKYFFKEGKRKVAWIPLDHIGNE